MATDDGLLQASIGDILDVAREVSAIAEEFNRRLSIINSQVNRFLDGGWTGGSGSAYSDAFRAWNKGTTEVQSGLVQMGGALADNAKAYANLDHASAEHLAAFEGPASPHASPPLDTSL